MPLDVTNQFQRRLRAVLEPEITNVEKLLLITLIVTLAVYAIDASIGVNVGRQQRMTLAQEAIAKQELTAQQAVDSHGINTRQD